MSELVNKKNVIFDATTLSSIMSCERLADFTHNLNFRPIDGKGKSLEMGSLAHVILQNYYKSVRDGLKRADAIAYSLSVGERYIIGDPNDEENFPGIHNVQSEDIEHVINTMKEYWLHYNNEYWTPIDIEKVKAEIIYEDDEVRVLWKVKYDLTVDTNQGIYPVDHKTMAQRRDTLSLNNQFMGQCVVARTNGVIINKIGWQKTLKPAEKFTRPMVNYSTDRLNEWKQIVGYYAKYWAELNEAQYFPPRFSHCDKFAGCIFRSVCESDRGMREEELKQHFIVGKAWEPVDD